MIKNGESERIPTRGLPTGIGIYTRLYILWGREDKIMLKPNILITGATGFVGARLVAELLLQQFSISAIVRGEDSVVPVGAEKIIKGNLTNVSDWFPVLKNIDIVIHVAGRAHIMNDDAIDPVTEFRKVNTNVTLNLAKQAAEIGVKRFVFISSVKVNGEKTYLDKPFKPDDDFVPCDPYGLSKYEAEKGLMALSKETSMEVVIIRPPLIYGAGVKANFASMIRWMDKGIPLPFGAVHNQRSLVALDNLVSFIICCISHPKAANEIFLISDGEDVSTTQLLKKVADALGKKTMLIPIPVGLMKLVAKLMAKSGMANRLFASLQVDSSKAHDLLAWEPVISMEEQLQKTVDAYLNEKTI